MSIVRENAANSMQTTKDILSFRFVPLNQCFVPYSMTDLSIDGARWPARTVLVRKALSLSPTRSTAAHKLGLLPHVAMLACYYGSKNRWSTCRHPHTPSYRSETSFARPNTVAQYKGGFCMDDK